MGDNIQITTDFRNLQPGQEIVYFVGFLAAKRSERTKPVLNSNGEHLKDKKGHLRYDYSDEAVEANIVAEHAWRLYESGEVDLYQRQIEPPKPTGNYVRVDKKTKVPGYKPGKYAYCMRRKIDFMQSNVVPLSSVKVRAA